MELGNSYFEFLADGVMVHVVGLINGILVGEEKFKISYLEFNDILNSELPKKEDGVEDWGFLNRFMTTREGNQEYIFPVGTYEVALQEDGLHVKQKIGSNGWSNIDCIYEGQKLEADWDTVYSVEWLLNGNIHTMRSNGIVSVVNVQRVVSGFVGTEACVLEDVPFLKNKLTRDVNRLWGSDNRITSRKSWWVSGAEMIVRKVTEEDMSIRRFRDEVLRSQRERNGINWGVM